MNPVDQIGRVKERLDLQQGKSVRNHLLKIGYRRIVPPGPAGYKARSDWYETKRTLAFVEGPNKATIYERRPIGKQ